MKHSLPVFNIGHFSTFGGPPGFYAEKIRSHVQKHAFTARPHKHDFFLVVLFTKGSGTHEVDFTRYSIRPGTLFLLSPGQAHQWQLSTDIDGVIFFHTRGFFEQGFSSQQLKDFPFFGSIYNPPLLRLRENQLSAAQQLFTEILDEYKHELDMKYQRLLSLVNLLYIQFLRAYRPAATFKNPQYLVRLRQFEDLLDKHFKEIKLPSDYADLMNITERHLNRISKSCLDKTPSDLILDRNMLEAKRLLMHEGLQIADIAARLGYPDPSYFSRLFKKQNGQTPREFVGNYKL